MVFDWSINIPTLIALGTILVGVIRIYTSYVRLEFKVEELWTAYKKEEHNHAEHSYSHGNNRSR